jgi:hypothetical protein
MRCRLTPNINVGKLGDRLRIRPDWVVADEIADLRDKFADAFTGWLEIEETA